MIHNATQHDYALAIRALNADHGASLVSVPSAPVVYDLIGNSTDIGSAEDNHIVLTGPGVEPHHLAIRQMEAGLFVLVDRAAATRRGDTAWMDPRLGDSFFCSEHGQVPRLTSTGRCPVCSKQRKKATLWLLRPLNPGDTFLIGEAFEANILSQGQPNDLAIGPEADTDIWPETLWLENAPRQPIIRFGDERLRLTSQPYPIEDSNLWVWHPPESPIPIFIHQRVNRFCTRHAASNTDREVGGLLLGNVYRDPEGETIYPVITHAVAARFATEERGHLTFTRDTWLHLNRQCEEQYPDKRVVGWYHTHPGLDIFLSQMDLFVHCNFFREPWQVALVIDPQQDAAGFFVWSNGEILDPQQPYQLFRVADLDDDTQHAGRSRIRIKLGERVI